MTSKNYTDLINIADHLAVVPQAISDKTYDILEQALDGKLEVVDPNNPWTFLLEASASMTAMAVLKSQNLTRKQYRGLAQNETDLAIHMADTDHIARFSKPASHKLFYAINRQELINRSVFNPLTNYRKAIIPKDTIWSVNGVDFYHHWPLVVDISPGGDMTCYFDTSVETPLAQIEDNLIKTEVVVWNDQATVKFEIPVDQLTMSSTSYPTTSSTGLKELISFAGKFYYARVYHSSDNVVWTEMLTTHTRESYDISKTTAILTVADNTLQVTIPRIYFTNNMVRSTTRVDIFTTEGEVSIDLGAFTAAQWSADFQDPSGQAGLHSDPFLNAATYNIVSSGLMSGGHNGITFEELKESVFYGLEGKRTAVTPKELENQLDKLGFDVTSKKDSVTGRVYVATSKLPKPAIDEISTVPGSLSADVFFDATNSDLGDQIVDKDDGYIVIKSGSLFTEQVNGITFESEAKHDALAALEPYPLSSELNTERHFYNPFHYVLDGSTNLFESRCYYLDSPELTHRLYSSSNKNLGFDALSGDWSISLDDTNYIVKFTSTHTADLTNMVAFLVYTSTSGAKFYFKSTQTSVGSTTSTFEFTLETDLRINHQNHLLVKDVFNSSNTKEDLLIPIGASFDVVTAVETSTNTSSDFDSSVPAGAHVNTTSNISLEKVTIKLGTHLHPFHTRSRPNVSSPVFETYGADVNMTYPADVPFKDTTGIVVNVDADGNVSIPIEHHEGDLVQEDGVNGLLHKKGSYVRNELGDPTVITAERVTRILRLFLVDRKFYHATESRIVSYRDELPKVIVNSTEEIRMLSPDLHAMTNLYYEPKSTDSNALVRVNSLKTTTTNTSVSFTVEITLRREDVDNNELREVTESSVRAILAEAVSGNFYSYSDTISKLSGVGGNSVIGINYTCSLPGDTVTIEDVSSSFSIATRIIPSSTGILEVEDDVDFTFIKG